MTDMDEEEIKSKIVYSAMDAASTSIDWNRFVRILIDAKLESIESQENGGKLNYYNVNSNDLTHYRGLALAILNQYLKRSFESSKQVDEKVEAYLKKLDTHINESLLDKRGTVYKRKPCSLTIKENSSSSSSSSNDNKRLSLLEHLNFDFDFSFFKAIKTILVEYECVPHTKSDDEPHRLLDLMHFCFKKVIEQLNLFQQQQKSTTFEDINVKREFIETDDHRDELNLIELCG
jgi:hypothetical protein